MRAVFWFVGPDCHAFLQWAAFAWWSKLDALRQYGRGGAVDAVDRDIEQHLRKVLQRFARENQRWKVWLRREIGDDAQRGIWRFREAVETCLGNLAGRDSKPTRIPPSPYMDIDTNPKL